ncbi:EAL domain-containing protein [Uliginosibacterium sediminicola]|uniref:EAL domain-containing protein n=1 Tax=Uliginosibacterium sediminicola TaxID=2024550 RepID=A0ABU9YTW8_9RHOO
MNILTEFLAKLPTPLDWPYSLLFIALAFLLIHVAHSLFAAAAVSMEPGERSASAARYGSAVGCMCWALDLAGLFLNPQLPKQITLHYVLFALIVMNISTRLTMPPLIATHSPRRVVLQASLILAIGMTLGHLLLASSFGTLPSSLQTLPTLGAIALATGVCAVLSLRHRNARLRAQTASPITLPFYVKLAAACCILYLHTCLVAITGIQGTHQDITTSSLLSIAALLSLAVYVSLDHLMLMRRDCARNQQMNSSLALMHTMHPEPNSHAQQRISLIAERLPSLLNAQSLQLHFQPIQSIGAGATSVRLEALLRVHTLDLGRVSPESFFIACDRMQLATRADRIIIEQALSLSRPWSAHAHCKGISVNVGPQTLLEACFADWLASRYERNDWPTDWLQLELTEHAMIAKPKAIASAIQRLAAQGVPVVMDDFGAGYSSLGLLVELPITGIKCDRAFVSTLQQDPARQALLQHICNMAHALELSVTVEGVETEHDLALIRSLGADAIQGYVLAKPMSSADMDLWLSHSPRQALTWAAA